MDNITHTLIGVTLGEAIVRARGRSRPELARFRPAILWATALASNLPDFDFAMGPFVGGGKLGYLLHHRGFTHTVALSPFMAVVAVAFGFWVQSLIERKTAEKSMVAWKSALPTLAIAAWSGALLHIGADFWNDYGVHPFWPLVNRWFYGDFIMIIEPLIWGALLPFLFFSARALWGRVLCAIASIGILGIAIAGPYMGWPIIACVVVWMAVGYFTQHKSQSVSQALGSALTVLVVFSASAQKFRSDLLSVVPENERVVSLVTTPAPSNPFCWRVILATVSINNPDFYRARVGVLAWGQAPRTCFTRYAERGQQGAPLEMIDTTSIVTFPGSYWLGEFRGDLGQLKRLIPQHCQIEAALRFMRIPYWVVSGAETTMGDLRYDYGRGSGFATVVSREGETCDVIVPPWDPPFGVFSETSP